MTSNDPINPTTQISITAFIEVEFNFASYSLDFGKVSKDDTATKSTYLQIKNPQSTKITDIVASSPFISAKQLEPSEPIDSSRIEIEIRLLPGLPLGRINQTVTAHSNLTSKPQATLQLGGIIVGDVEVTPEALSFVISQSADGSTQVNEQRLTIHDKPTAKPLKILSVRDSHDRLQLDLSTINEGREFEIMASLKQETMNTILVNKNLRGSILITTDNPDQPEITVLYNVTRRR